MELIKIGKFRILWFNYWEGSRELELDFCYHGSTEDGSGKDIQLRLSTHQFAFWINHKPIVDISLKDREWCKYYADGHPMKDFYGKY